VAEKRKKSASDAFHMFEDEFFTHSRMKSAAGSGYSISVAYGRDGKPLVKVQTQGDVNKTALRKQLKKKYPDARIEGLAEEPLIREMSTRTLKPKKTKKSGKQS
jgi:hypothetical protein